MKLLTNTLALAACCLLTPAFAPNLSAAEETAESLDAIVAKATEQQRPILLEFTGSDWCPPCMMMDKNVFSKKEFQDFAGEKLVYVKLDFPRTKKQAEEIKARNEALAEKFGIQGFPTVVVLNSAGKELARKVGAMSGGPSNFIAWVEKATN